MKDNYAKFELDNPMLHFSLNVRPFEKKGVLNHLGFQVQDTEEVLAMGVVTIPLTSFKRK